MKITTDEELLEIIMVDDHLTIKIDNVAFLFVEEEKDLLVNL